MLLAGLHAVWVGGMVVPRPRPAYRVDQVTALRGAAPSVEQPALPRARLDPGALPCELRPVVGGAVHTQSWEAMYGHHLLALETCEESLGRFNATVYWSANWERVGRTVGRGRDIVHHEAKLPQKDIYILPLAKHQPRESAWLRYQAKTFLFLYIHLTVHRYG